MKKILSLLLVLALSIGMTTIAFAAKAPTPTEVSKTGVLKAFTATTITVLEEGKTISYTLEKGTKVESQGAPADLMETAKKGLKVQYKVQLSKGKPTSTITYLDIPSVGNEYVGLVSLGVTDTRTTIADSNAFSPSTSTYNSITGLIDGIYYSSQENPAETEGVYVFDKPNQVSLGFINLVKESVKITLNGKDIKVIDEKANFDAATVGDEAKLIGTPGKTTTGVPGINYTIVFEAPITDKTSLTQEEADQILKVIFQKKPYTLTEMDLYSSQINEDVYSELNGKEVPLAKAMYRGNCAIVRSNAALEIIYVGAYYSDLKCKIVSINGNNITIDVLKNDTVAFRDTLVLSSTLEVFDKNGVESSKSALSANDLIKLTVDPYENYNVTLINTINK
jgi:hypothetical protein